MDRDRDGGFQGQRRVGEIADRTGRLGDAQRVGLRHRHLHIDVFELVVGTAEFVFLEFGIGVEVARDLGGAFARQAGRRRAIEEAAFGADADRLAGVRDLGLRRQRHFKALRHEVGDVELHAADRIGLGIDIGGDLPAPVRRTVGEIEPPGAGARHQLVARNRDAGHFQAIRARRDQRQRRGHRRADAVAQHGGGLHGLAGAIDATLGIDIGIDRAGRLAPADAAVGQVEGGAAQIEEREVAA